MKSKLTLLSVIIGIMAGTDLLAQNNLVAYYPLNGSAIDAYVNAYNGTVNGATLTTDRFGNANSAYSFDGTNDNITLPVANLQLANYSYSLWVKPNSTATSSVISIGGNTADQFILLDNSNGWTGGSYNTALTPRSTSTMTGADTNWHHLVFTRENAAIKIYVDGSLANSNSSASATGAGYSGGTLRATIGSRCDLAQYFNGKIDDVKIYNRVLNSTEVSELYTYPSLYKTTTTGIANLSPDITFLAYPNPSNGTVFLRIDNPIKSSILYIHNAQGQLVYVKHYPVNESRVEGLSKGLYFCSLEQNGIVVHSIKLVVTE